jgi:hypothetical protein
MLEHPILANADSSPAAEQKQWQSQRLKDDQVHSSDVEKKWCSCQWEICIHEHVYVHLAS